MAKSKQEIINDIVGHFRGLAYKSCYVGITSDKEKRLFGDHNVPRTGAEGGHWITRVASSNTVARGIEKHFLDAGMDGGGGGRRLQVKDRLCLLENPEGDKSIVIKQ